MNHEVREKYIDPLLEKLAEQNRTYEEASRRDCNEHTGKEGSKWGGKQQGGNKGCAVTREGRGK